MENKTFKEAIKSYLDKRARTDELFAKSYAKENKNLDECCSYIMGKPRSEAMLYVFLITRYLVWPYTITTRTT